MRSILLKEDKIAAIYNVLFHVALSSTIFQAICPIYTLFTNVRIDLICFIAILILWFAEICRYGLKPFIDCFWNVINRTKTLFLFCVIYFLWDTVNLFYAQDPGFLYDKYKVWSKIGLLSLTIIYYVNPLHNAGDILRKIKNIILNLGLTGCAICIIANIGYYTGIYTQSIRAMITVADHNVFSSYIMIGFIAVCYLIVNDLNIDLNKRLVFLLAILSICAPVLYLSGSRRTIILLYCFAFFFAIYVIYILQRETQVRRLRTLAKSILFLAIVIALCIVQVRFFDNFSDKRYEEKTNEVIVNQEIEDEGIKTDENYLAQDTNIVEENIQSNIENSEEHAIKQEENIDYYVETIIDGSGMDLRKMIWKAAVNWYREMTIEQKIFGGGASYSYDVFNDISNPINKDVVEHYGVKEGTTRWMGPHNFLLSDLLTGGVIKLLIDFLIMGDVIITLFRMIKKAKEGQVFGIMLFNLYIVLFVNLMLGSAYGIFGPRTIWIVLSLTFVINWYLKGKKVVS